LPDETRKVPLVASAPISEFGDFTDDISRPPGLETDGTYVPGFSELRVAHDTAVGAFLRKEIPRGDIPTLPVNLRWARVQNKAGQPDSTKPFKHQRKGYRFVTKDQINETWLREIPGGTEWGADGHLHNGDCALMWCPREQAAKNEAARRQDTEARSTGVTNTFIQNLAQAGTGTYRGADVSVEKTVGPPLGSGDK
jgi:hypothetical protein